MKLALGMLFCCLMSVAQAGPVQQPDAILLVGVERENHTGADAHGLVWDILRQVFEPAGLTVRTRVMPYTRAVGLVTRGDADAWVGAFPEERENAIFPKWHYAADMIGALGLVRAPVPSMHSLGDFRLVWVRGYGFDKYLPGLGDYQEIQRYNGVLAMLAQGHADFLIGARQDLESILRQSSNPNAYRITDLTLLPLYPGFADSQRGRELAELYDRRMAELVRDGSLRPIFERWQQHYPFD